MMNKDTILLEQAYRQVQQGTQYDVAGIRKDTGIRLMNYLNIVKDWIHQPDMAKYKHFLGNINSVLQTGVDDNTYDQAIKSLGEIAADPQVSQDKREQVKRFLDSIH